MSKELIDVEQFQSDSKDMHIQTRDTVAFQISSFSFFFKNYCADKGVMKQAFTYAAGGLN